MASDSASKRLAQICNTMGTDTYYGRMMAIPSLQAVPPQTRKMASDDAYKRLAQVYNTMGTDMYYRPLVVDDILKDYVNIDYELPECALFHIKMPEVLNSTALELAVKKKDIKIFKFLIQRGADFTRKNKQGSTVLHQTIHPSVYNDNTMYWMIESPVIENPFAEVVLASHVIMPNSSNPRDNEGMSHFHVACMTDHAQAVEFFLKAGVSPNQAISNESTTFPGFTPLHLAVKVGAVETLQLLLRTDVKINTKNAKGMSPLELLMMERMDIWMKLTEAMRFGWTPNATHYQHYFDLNVRMMVMILLKFDSRAQVIDEATGLSRFHIACATTKPEVVREQLKHVRDLQHSVNATSTLWPGYTALHFAAHYKFQMFEMLLDAGADLLAVDSKGQTPFDVCLRNFELREIEAILRRKDDWANIKFSDGRNGLLDFIVALQNVDKFEAYLKENFVDMNVRIAEDAPLCQGWTPLHLAVVCFERLRERRFDEPIVPNVPTPRYDRCLGLCMLQGADLAAKNSQGSTPLHLAFQFKDGSTMSVLLQMQNGAENPTDNAGISHLHLASLANCSDLARKLPRDSEDIDVPLEIGDFVWTKSSLIRNGATPLSIALSIELEEKCSHHGVDTREAAETLIERGARIPEDEVERLAKTDVATLLLQRFPLDIERVLRHCDPKLIVAEMQTNAQLRDYLVERHGLTRLHVAVLIGGNVEELTDDANARVPLDSPVWPGCTCLHLLVVRRRFSKVTTVARLLLGRGANVTVKNAREATPIHEAFDWFMEDRDISSLLDTLLTQFEANPVDPRGISHFHVAAAVGKVDVVEGFLSNGVVNIDGKIDDFSDCFAGYTALHLAVAFGRDEVVETLLEHKANVHCQTLLEDWPMHVAAANGSADEIEGVVKSLMGAGAKINETNLFGETPLEKLLKFSGVTVEKVELFVKYGCEVEVVNMRSFEGCLARALKLKDKSICKLLINAYDHTVLGQFPGSAIHNIVTLKRPSWNLLNYRTIDELFTPITDYVKVILELTAIDLDIDSHDRLGITPLHHAAFYQNVTGVIALLKCGADINVEEQDGHTPFEACINNAFRACPITEETGPDNAVHMPVSQLDALMINNCRMQIWKLCFLKLHVSESNLHWERKFQTQTSWKGPVIQNCQEEIQAMDKEKIGSIALRDFLCDTGVVAAYPTMLYDLRNSIDEYFKTNVDRLLEEFPEFSSLLLLQYRKARKRLDMAESCNAALQFLVNLGIPRLCSDRVFRFLTYEDLKNLVASREL